MQFSRKLESPVSNFQQFIVFHISQRCLYRRSTATSLQSPEITEFKDKNLI
jgi:hypothetical protein